MNYLNNIKIITTLQPYNTSRQNPTVSQFQNKQLSSHSSQSSQREEQIVPLNFNRNHTQSEHNSISLNIPQQYLTLKKLNSTFDIQNEKQSIKYGDNIYLKQLTSNHHQQSANNTHQNTPESQQRLKLDYQLTNAIHSSFKNHKNLICLNRLERILYYVKKITYNKSSEQQILDLAYFQINLLHRDENLTLLRLYQSWIENQSIYMSFQLASYSLAEKNYQGVKLRQHQIWIILKGCMKGIQFLSSQSCQHLNIKPGNILKCRQSYKLSDPYGNFQFMKHQIGQEHDERNVKYCAPEIVKFWKYLQGINFLKCDIYSLGICILQNLIGSQVFSMSYKILKYHLQRDFQTISFSLKKLLLKMINPNPIKRPQIEQIICENLQVVDLKVVRKLSL